MKTKRQDRICDLIAKFVIETQDDLIERLNEEGYSVTQATISRDIRELRISKVLGENGKYHYTLPKQPTDPLKKDLRHTYMDSVTSVACGGNIVVIKTHPGLAQAVAAGIDAMHIPELLGCVAGDDTIFAVAKDTDTAGQIAARLSANLEA
ncbi:MAG: arginine repressor [Clostridia bacterium]|nr:arginine repressor [Clostridia bacterium]